MTGNPKNAIVYYAPYLQNEFGDPVIFFYVFNLIYHFLTAVKVLKKLYVGTFGRERPSMNLLYELPQVKVSEKSLCLTFRNIGVNINWCGPLFCILSKIAPTILKLGGN